MPGCGKSCGETATLGPGAAQDSYLHPAARSSFARFGRVATYAACMAMGSIVMRSPEPELSVANLHLSHSPSPAPAVGEAAARHSVCLYCRPDMLAARHSVGGGGKDVVHDLYF